MTARGTRPGQSGFTLLEVIVALAVVSLGLIAAFNLVVQIGSGSLHMKERTFGSWVAANEITRIRLGGEFPEVSEFDGDVEFGGVEYRWRAKVSETGVEDLRRIDMEVAYAGDPEVVIASSVGFISPPAPARLGGVSWTAAPSSNNGDSPGDGQEDRQTGDEDQPGDDARDRTSDEEDTQ